MVQRLILVSDTLHTHLVNLTVESRIQFHTSGLALRESYCCSEAQSAYAVWICRYGRHSSLREQDEMMWLKVFDYPQRLKTPNHVLLSLSIVFTKFNVAK